MVVSMGLLFQEKVVSGIRALIDLAGSVGRGSEGTKPARDVPGVGAEARGGAGGSAPDA